jgi:hypothetical protein
MMLFEQNGRTMLMVKSSLTAYEGVIDYHYKKNAYKTPEEFRALVVEDFQKNCLLIANQETMRLVRTSVVLGHETTVFAEVENMPAKLHTLQIKNSLFQDIPSSLCELILSLNGLPQKIYLFNMDNGREVIFRVQNKKWVEETSGSFFKPRALFIIGTIVLGIGFWFLGVKKRARLTSL